MADWGFLGETNASGSNGGYTYYQGGISPTGINRLDSITQKVNGATTVRAALYMGGAVGDLDGAVLIEDLGSVAGDTPEIVIPSTTLPTIPDGSFIWVAIRFSSGAGRRNFAAPPQDDIDSIQRIFGSADVTDAFPASLSVTGEVYTAATWGTTLQFSEVVNVTITTPPTDIRRTEDATVAFSSTANTPTAQNTNIMLDGVLATLVSLTPVSGDDYTAVINIPDDAAIPYGNKDLILTVAGDSATASAIPFQPVTGNTFIPLIDTPLLTSGSMLQDFIPETVGQSPGLDDQLETTISQNGATVTPINNGALNVEPWPTSSAVFSGRLIRSTGAIGSYGTLAIQRSSTSLSQGLLSKLTSSLISNLQSDLLSSLRA